LTLFFASGGVINNFGSRRNNEKSRCVRDFDCGDTSRGRVITEAQQSAKMPRVAYLAGVSATADAPRAIVLNTYGSTIVIYIRSESPARTARNGRTSICLFRLYL
jgi:hypothetical protein